MNASIVQNKDGTGEQPRDDILLKERLDIIAFHRSELVPTTEHPLDVQSPQNRQVLAAVERHGFDQALVSLSPPVMLIQR